MTLGFRDIQLRHRYDNKRLSEMLSDALVSSLDPLDYVLYFKHTHSEGVEIDYVLVRPFLIMLINISVTQSVV